jgi:hypothetical protein
MQMHRLPVVGKHLESNAEEGPSEGVAPECSPFSLTRRRETHDCAMLRIQSVAGALSEELVFNNQHRNRSEECMIAPL